LKEAYDMHVLKKLIIVAVLVMFVPVFLIAGQGDKDAGMERKTVVLLILGTQTPYCPPYVSNFTTKLNEVGIGTFVFDAKFDAALQASQMDDAIAMQPDLICLFALDSAGMAPGIKKSYDAGVPVMMINNRCLPESEQYTLLYAGPDVYQEGQVAAELMNEVLGGSGNVVMLEGATGQEAQLKRADGFTDRLAELNSDIEVIARQTAGWRKDLSVQVMQDFIVRYGDEIDGVYAQDDTMAIGAWVAMDEAGFVPGEVPIVGIGGSREGLAAINDGIQYATVMQSPIVETNLVVDFVIKVLDRGMKPGDQWDPYLNYMDLPRVTKDNVEQYLPGDW
jgi:ABC-type sugar transport system substrate-binding protein